MPAAFDLTEWFLSLTSLEMAFALCAVAGGLLFFIRIVMAFFIGDGDMGADPDADFADGADGGFQLLSIQGLSGFFMMFGLVGLMLEAFDVHSGFSVLGGFTAGSFVMWLTALITFHSRRLQSSGNVRIERAVGSEGTVYLTIPKNGTGQVEINLQNRSLIYDAVSEDKKEIKTGVPVRVVKVVSGRILAVQAI